MAEGFLRHQPLEMSWSHNRGATAAPVPLIYGFELASGVDGYTHRVPGHSSHPVRLILLSDRSLDFGRVIVSLITHRFDVVCPPPEHIRIAVGSIVESKDFGTHQIPSVCAGVPDRFMNSNSF